MDPTGGSADLRVLFLTLEYAEQYIFSGNGVYSRAFVHHLAKSGNARVMVICGRPAGQTTRPRPPSASKSSALVSFEQTELVKDKTNEKKNPSISHVVLNPDFTREGSKIEVYTVSLPVWFKLDRQSSWKEFGEGVERYSSKVAQFRPDIVLGVDWTSRNAWDTLRRLSETRLINVPFVYLCFRVFSATPHLSQEERVFYAQREAEIIQGAVRTVALSRCDAHALDDLRTMTLPRGTDVARASASLIQVITPPLRDDIRNASLKLTRLPLALSQQKTKWSWSHSPLLSSALGTNGSSAQPVEQPSFASRSYVTCCCRISPEKEVMRFVEIVESIEQFLKSNDLVPYLVGPAADEEYARKVYQRLKRAFPGDSSIVVSDFVPADKLQSIFARTVLNIHPARNEPFGMSITEAAAFGVPTLLDSGGAVGATDVLPFIEHKSLGCNMKSVTQASRTMKSLLRKEARSFLEFIGKHAQDAVLRWGSSEWARHVRRELLDDILKNSFRAYDHSSLPDVSSPKSLERNEEDETWPWLPIMEWASDKLNHGSIEGIVYQVDLDGVRLVVEQILKLSAYSFASLLISMKQAKQTQPVEMTPEMYEWAWFLLSKTDTCLPNARFRLVPSRMSEDLFWGLFFGMVRDGVIRLVMSQREDTRGRDVDSMPQENEQGDGEAKQEQPIFTSDVDLKCAAIMRLVQRDECARGIAPIVEFVGEGVLADSARSIFHSKRVLILTGFPCLVNSPSPQETDGPCGAVALAKACASLGKRVFFVIEEPIANVMRAAIAQVFPKSRSMLLRSQSLTRVENFGNKGQVTLEIFPSKSEFTEAHHARLMEILMELSSDQGHMIAIERAGPAFDAKCRTMRGRVMDDTLLAPLHVIFGKAKQVNVPTTGIGDGGNEVGMGAAYDVVRTKMGENIACVVGCDFLIPTSVSNWGGHALTAALALVAIQNELMNSENAIEDCIGTNDVHLKVIKACLDAGAGDGITGQRDVPFVDGLPFSKTLEVIESLRQIVQSFKRDE